MYFISYTDNINKINVLYLLYLYGIAEYNKTNNYIDTINYISARKLTEKINKKYNKSLSNSTINRFLKDIISGNYNDFLTIDTAKKQILLKNHFRRAKNCAFVALNKNIFDTLIEIDEDLFCKYTLYLYFVCGKYQKTDSTAEQILSALGYSAQSGKNKSNLSRYNGIL